MNKTIGILASKMRINLFKKINFSHPKHQIRYFNTDQKFKPLVNKLLDQAKNNKLDGLMGIIDESNLAASILSHKYNFSGPHPKNLIKSQTKHFFRKKENEILNNPVDCKLVDQELLQQDISFPKFVKPSKSAFSDFAFKVESKSELLQIYNKWKKRKDSNKEFKELLEISKRLGVDLGDYEFRDSLILEDYIEGDVQLTIDGYVFQGGVNFYGTTKSSFKDDSLSFHEFKLPYNWSSLDFKEKVFSKLEVFVKELGIDNTLFNIEVKLDTNKQEFRIIEINTRVSPQFIFMFKHVIGVNPLQAGIDIAAGSKPNLERKYDTKKVAFCFILRKDSDKKVLEGPSQRVLQNLENKYSDDCIISISSFVDSGMKLSDIKQDTDTFRYAQIKIAADSEKQARSKKNLLEKKVSKLFHFRDHKKHSYPPHRG